MVFLSFPMVFYPLPSLPGTVGRKGAAENQQGRPKLMQPGCSNHRGWRDARCLGGKKTPGKMLGPMMSNGNLMGNLL